MKTSRTVVPAGTGAIVGRFWKAAQRLPAQVWQRWAMTLGIGVVVISILSHITAKLGMGSAALQAWDRQMLLAISEQSTMSFAMAVTWESPSNLVGSVPMILTFIALTSWFSQPLAVATVMMGYGLQFVWVWTG